MKILKLILIFCAFSNILIFAQNPLENLKVSGNVQIDAQVYNKDSLIGAEDVKEKLRANSYLYVNFMLKNFNAGLRYENYSKPLLGFDPAYEGSGIPYRFLEFKSDNFDITAGNFYEQFGSGMILRFYEERQLGFDNALDGFRFKLKPVNGIELIGLIGKQRNFWSQGNGIVRGADLNISLSEFLEDFLPELWNLSIGGSAVSKYEADVQSYYNLPENVSAFAGRVDLTTENMSIYSEFAYKINDPNATNRFNFNPGTAFMIQANLFGEGYGFGLNLHRIDNMDFRSDRGARGNSLLINYIPAISKQQTYRLPSMYPYTTQLNGEVGAHLDFIYTFDKGTFFGGDYGTTLIINYSRVQSLDTTHTEMDTVRNRAFKYNSPFFKIGKRRYYQDIELEIQKTWSKTFKSNFSAINILYDKDILENEGAPKYGNINSTTLVADFTYKLSDLHSLRGEFQHMWVTQDSTVKSIDDLNGNWFSVLFEYSIAPYWFFSAGIESNYGNKFEERKINYYNISATYTIKSTRISLSYGRQRSGIICIGGVCRQVPSSNGPSLSITSSF